MCRKVRDCQLFQVVVLIFIFIVDVYTCILLSPVLTPNYVAFFLLAKRFDYFVTPFSWS